MISGLKSNDCLKTDGQNCDVLLLGLRNEFNLQEKTFFKKVFPSSPSSKRALLYSVGAQNCAGYLNVVGGGSAADNAGTFIDKSFGGFAEVAADRLGESRSH